MTWLILRDAALCLLSLYPRTDKPSTQILFWSAFLSMLYLLPQSQKTIWGTACFLALFSSRLHPEHWRGSIEMRGYHETSINKNITARSKSATRIWEEHSSSAWRNTILGQDARPRPSSSHRQDGSAPHLARRDISSGDSSLYRLCHLNWYNPRRT